MITRKNVAGGILNWTPAAGRARSESPRHFPGVPDLWMRRSLRATESLHPTQRVRGSGRNGDGLRWTVASWTFASEEQPA